MQSALIFLVKTLSDLYILTFLLRFILQWTRASYHNPLAQFVLKVTGPLVVPARRLLPSVRSVDVPTLAVMVALECIATLLLIFLLRASMSIAEFAWVVALRLVSLTLWFYTVAIFIYVILSWFGDRGYNPMATMLAELVEPVLRPIRRILPPVAGLDLAPLLVSIALLAVLIALPLPPYLR
jgi:YggT family protein